MVEMQEFLDKYRHEQSYRKKLLKKRMNDYELGINLKLLEEAKQRDNLKQELIQKSMTNKVTSYDWLTKRYFTL